MTESRRFDEDAFREAPPDANVFESSRQLSVSPSGVDTSLQDTPVVDPRSLSANDEGRRGTRLLILSELSEVTIGPAREALAGGGLVLLCNAALDVRACGSTPIVDDIRLAASQAVLGDHLKLDLAARTAISNGVELPLTRQEFELLRCLSGLPLRAWSFGELAQSVWGIDEPGDCSLVRSAVKRLRAKVAALADGVAVESVRGVGYRLRA